MDYLVDDYIVNEVDNTIDVLFFEEKDIESRWVKIPLHDFLTLIDQWNLNKADDEGYKYHKPLIWLIEMSKTSDIAFLLNEYTKEFHIPLPEKPEHRSCT